MTSVKRITVALALICLVAALGAEPLFAQCSMCRTALEGSAEGRQLQAGFNNAILFLLPFPYIIFGTLAGAIWLSSRKKSQKSQ